MLLHKSVEFDSRVRREASALARAGHQVSVLELAAVPAGATLDGFARRSVLPPSWVRRRLPSPAYRSMMLLFFVRGVRALRPDIVHAHDAAMLMPGLVGARLVGARLVCDSHELASSVPYRERSWAWFVRTVERLIVPRADAVITVSDGIAARLRDLYGLPVTPTVIRNVSALEPGGRGGLRRRLGIGPEVPLILHQGAPAPDRGCDVLVEAIASVPDARVAFLGNPEPGYGEELEARIRALGLEERVSLLPSVPLAELLAFTRPRPMSASRCCRTAARTTVSPCPTSCSSTSRPAYRWSPGSSRKPLTWCGTTEWVGVSDPTTPRGWQRRCVWRSHRVTMPSCTNGWRAPPRSCAGSLNRRS